jgi:hypothetical protein
MVLLQNLVFLIAVLKAIEQDNPAVPTLLTDYILKGKFDNLL